MRRVGATLVWLLASFAFATGPPALAAASTGTTATSSTTAAPTTTVTPSTAATSTTTATTTTTATPSTAATVSAAATAASNDPTVTIRATGCGGGALFCFVPANVTVTDGDAVTWTNASGVEHTVSRCTSGACSGTAGGSGTDAFATGTIAAPNGSTFSHPFHGAGTYNYYCTIHGFGVMHGTVTVVAATTSTTAAPGATPAPVSAGGSTASPATVSAAAAPASAKSSSHSSSTATLARTGVDARLLVFVATIALAAGALVVAASRRRARASTQ